MLNFPYNPSKINSDINVFNGKIKDRLTLHDYHAIFIDTASLFNTDYWAYYSGNTLDADFRSQDLVNYGAKIKEQVETGGVTFCFASNPCDHSMHFKDGYGDIIIIS